MIIYKTSNIFDSTADVLVNPVNCEGVMGKGLALQFKKIYPEMFNDYKLYCKNGLLKPGELYWWQNQNTLFNTVKYICCFATKKYWRNNSKLSWVELGLKNLCIDLNNNYPDIQSIAIPKLGSGSGGPDWITEVHPLIKQYFSNINLTIEIYL